VKQNFIIALIVLSSFTLTSVCFAGPKKRRKTNTAASAVGSKEKRLLDAADELIESLNGEPGTGRRDFTDVDFSALREQMDFSNKEIEGYIFDGAIFPEKTDFSGSEISWCSFVGASLVKAKFKGAKMVGVSFIGAKMYSTDFIRATMIYCNCEGTYFSGVVYDFEGKFPVVTDTTLFLYAIIRDCNFIGAKLMRANFAHARIFGTTLFNEADFEESVLDFDEVSLYVNFRGTTPHVNPERRCCEDSLSAGFLDWLIGGHDYNTDWAKSSWGACFKKFRKENSHEAVLTSSEVE